MDSAAHVHTTMQWRACASYTSGDGYCLAKEARGALQLVYPSPLAQVAEACEAQWQCGIVCKSRRMMRSQPEVETRMSPRSHLGAVILTLPHPVRLGPLQATTIMKHPCNALSILKHDLDSFDRSIRFFGQPHAYGVSTA